MSGRVLQIATIKVANRKYCFRIVFSRLARFYELMILMVGSYD
jgi:hypothetical protein